MGLYLNLIPDGFTRRFQLFVSLCVWFWNKFVVWIYCVTHLQLQVYRSKLVLRAEWFLVGGVNVGKQCKHDTRTWDWEKYWVQVIYVHGCWGSTIVGFKMFTNCTGFQCLIPNNLFLSCDHPLTKACKHTRAAWIAHTFKYTGRYKNITYIFRLHYFVVACGWRFLRGVVSYSLGVC